MKKLILITLIMTVAAISIAATGAVTTTVMTPRFLAYSTATQMKLNAKIDASNPVYSGALTSSSADGTHYVQPYNSVVFSGTPSTGMIQTNSSGIQYYNGSAWVTPVTDISGKLDVSRFTNYSSTHISSGTVNNYYSGGGSGQTVSEVTDSRNINRGLYVVNSVGGKKLTFQNHSSGKTSIYNSYSSVYLKPDGATSNFKFGTYTTGHGHSIRLSTGWYEAVAWNTPLFQFVMFPAGGITKTGFDEYAVAGGSYLVEEYFNGNLSAWTLAGSTTPVITSGELDMVDTGTDPSATSGTFTAQSTIYAAFKFRLTDNTSITAASVFRLRGDTTDLLKLQHTNGEIKMIHGATTTTGYAISADTTYYVWVKYVAGSGSNGSADLYISTTGTKPAVTKQIVGTGTATASADNIGLGGRHESSANHTYIDDVLVSASDIGDL